MKFGKTLKRVLYPPWSDYYVDYKFLKGVIKKCAAALEQHIQTATASADSKDDTTRLYGLHRLEFFLWIAREVAKVSGFYERQLTEWEEQYGRMVGGGGGGEEHHQSQDELRVLCDLLDKMRSFVLLNHLAFIKILKKYDKHVSSLTHTALSAHHLTGLLGYGPSNETGSASVACMATIMHSAFYSSPRLAVLLTNVQVQMAVRQRGSGAGIGMRMEQKEESKENEQMITYDGSGKGGMADVTSSTADSTTSEDDYEFTCPICLDVLSLPVILSCSHKFCFQCLANWSTQSQKCPVCRLEHPLHPDSYTVSSTLDAFLKKTYKQQDARGKDDQAATRNAERGVEDTVMATATGEYDDDEQANYADDPAIVSKPGRRSVHANPQKGIYTHSLHHHTVNSLKHINTLLDVATSGSYVVFDIDDTLLTNLYTPCLLTTDKGIQAYQAILARNPLYAELTLKQKNAVTRVLQRALDSKRLVESDTQLVIRSLQEMGCTLFGLTKRWSESSAETRKELLTMGIDFVSSSPFPRGRKYCDECTESLLVDGVIYTNGHEKGPVLDRFLSQIVFAQHLQHHKAAAAGKDTAMESKELPSPTPQPAPTNAAIAPDCPAAPAPQPSSPTSRNTISSFASMLMSSIPNPFQQRDNKSESNFTNPRSPRQSPPPPVPASIASLAAVPSNLIFVDDLHENAHSVFHDLTLCQHLSIPIISCHYTAVKDQMEDMLKQYEQQMRREHSTLSHSHSSSHSADDVSSGDDSNTEDKLASPTASSHHHHTSSTSSMLLDESASTVSGVVVLPALCTHSDMEILQYQVYHLVHKQQVINDQQARFIITKLKQKAQQTDTTTNNNTHANSSSGKSSSRRSGRKDGGGREKRRSDGDEESGSKAVAMDVRGSEMMEVEVSH